MQEILRPYHISNDDTMLLLSIVIFAAYAFVIYRGKDTFLHKWTNFFTNRKATGGESQTDTNTEIQNNLILIPILSISAGIIFCDKFTHTTTSTPYTTIFAIAGIMLIYTLAKSALYSFINWIFFEWETNAKWIAAYFFLISLTALILFPIAMMKVFMEWNTKTTIICTAILLILYKIMLFCKLCINFKYKNYGFLLLFLYFCTLEIIPVMIGWKILI